MKEKKPISYKIFIVTFTLTSIVFLLASLINYFQADKKHSMTLAFIMMIVFALAAIGMYTGFTNKTELSNIKKYNRIGLIGNLLIFVLTIGLMAIAAFTTA